MRKMRRRKYKKLFRKHRIQYDKILTKEDLEKIWDKYKSIMGIK